MAIATLDAYKAALGRQGQLVPVTIGSLTASAGRSYDLWMYTAPIPAAPTTAVALDRASTGALGQFNAGSGLDLGVLGARFSAFAAANYILVDRLSHQGGLSGTVATAQTTNLPTAALSRQTSGVGVMVDLTIYSAVGTTASSVSLSYTNSDGTSGRTSPSVAFGGTGFREAGRNIHIPLQEGDVGVRSVESVTLAGTTGTVGNFGVTLYKPLFAVLIADTSGVLSAGGLISGNTFGGVPLIEDDACLALQGYMAGINISAAGTLLVSEF